MRRIPTDFRIRVGLRLVKPFTSCFIGSRLPAWTTIRVSTLRNLTKNLFTVGLAVQTALCAGAIAPSVMPDSSASSTKSSTNTPRAQAAHSVSAPARANANAASVSSSSSTVEWQVYQRPSIGNAVQKSSIQQAPAPGPAAGRPPSEVMRYELDKGALFTSSGYTAHRAEVYGRMPTSTSAPATAWPDPEGAVRWYTFSVYMPTDFATTADTKWLVITQWKGLNGGSPPVALEVKRDGLRLGGTRTNRGLIPNDGALGPIPRGKWTTLSVGMRLSASPTTGWVEVIRDGKTVLPRVHVATMDTINGKTDPIYLKQGLYQDSSWSVPHVIYFSPVTVSATPPSGAQV